MNAGKTNESLLIFQLILLSLSTCREKNKKYLNLLKKDFTLAKKIIKKDNQPKMLLKGASDFVFSYRKISIFFFSFLNSITSCSCRLFKLIKLWFGTSLKIITNKSWMHWTHIVEKVENWVCLRWIIRILAEWYLHTDIDV